MADFFQLMLFRRIPAKNTGAFDRCQNQRRNDRHQYPMPFYRFHVCDPENPIDGHGHDGAALADDIDAMLFAASIIQRLVQEHPAVPLSWAIKIVQDARQVGVLPFDAGCKVLLRPHRACDPPARNFEAW